MANIRDIKKRIKGGKQTLKITSALKLVSGSMLAKVQARTRQAKPYYEELEESLKSLTLSLDPDYKNIFFRNTTQTKKSLILVYSSERGLCGSYNSVLIRKVRDFIKENTATDFVFYSTGKKAEEMLKDRLMLKRFSFAKSEPSFGEIEFISKEITQKFVSGEVDKIYIAYNKFVSALTFVPVIKEILPFNLNDFMDNSSGSGVQKSKGINGNFKLDLSPDELMDYLLPEVIASHLYFYQLSALTSEYSSRMWAMENASKNCKDLIKKLTLKMNKMRQGSITKELIEIVSGAETMKN